MSNRRAIGVAEKDHLSLYIITGIIFGLGAVILVKFGNPGNYGFCAACQVRDIAGAIGLHNAAPLRYVRPEILGWILGAFAISQFRGEFRSRGGASPAVRFLLGMTMMIGALAFLGCPLRSVLRIAGGDLNGITGLVGLIAGIGAGIFFLRRGYNPGKTTTQVGPASVGGYILPLLALFLLVAVFFRLPFLAFSTQGPGSMHAPIVVSLIAGLAAGLMAQRIRLCMTGGFRDLFLTGNTRLIGVYLVVFLSALAGNLYFRFFKLGYSGQPLAHTMHLWNFLGLFLVGLAGVLASGCPLRQLILSGDGNTDAGWSVLGMLAGASLAHRLNAAGSATGVSTHGQVAVIAGIVITAAIGFALSRQRVKSEPEKAVAMAASGD